MFQDYCSMEQGGAATARGRAGTPDLKSLYIFDTQVQMFWIATWWLPSTWQPMHAFLPPQFLLCPSCWLQSPQEILRSHTWPTHACLWLLVMNSEFPDNLTTKTTLYVWSQINHSQSVKHNLVFKSANNVKWSAATKTEQDYCVSVLYAPTTMATAGQ